LGQRERENPDFLSHFNLFLPVQPSPQKYFSSVFRKPVFLSPHPDSTGGAARDRHGRRKQDAVAVRLCSARVSRADENSFTDGEGVWSWSPDAGIKPWGDEPEGDGGKKARSPRRARYKP
jgi:hypothetical protein